MLTTDQFREFWEALRKAYPLANFDIMLKTRLGKQRENISVGPNLDKIVFDVINDAEMKGETLELINAARQSNPKNPDLLTFSEHFGLTSITRELEREVVEGLPDVDIMPWRTRLGEIEGQVCRIEIPKTKLEGIGTGFLVGPDLVLTNYHVVEDIVKQKYKPTDLVIRFDYRKAADGTELYAGTTFKAATKWLVDSAPYSTVDLKIDPGAELPASDNLDYALLRVDGNPGKTPVNPKTADPMAPGRGWISLPTAAVELKANDPLFIVQHPKARPLKLALNTQSILSVNGNRTRVRYRTNTEKGSSGSPCFDLDWNLVALHHSGDPDYDLAHKPDFNEGIPIDAIYSQLVARKFGSLINQAHSATS